MGKVSRCVPSAAPLHLAKAKQVQSEYLSTPPPCVTGDRCGFSGNIHCIGFFFQNTPDIANILVVPGNLDK